MSFETIKKSEWEENSLVEELREMGFDAVEVIRESPQSSQNDFNQTKFDDSDRSSGDEHTFLSESQCLTLFMETMYPNGKSCPKCDNLMRLSEKQLKFFCKCNKQETARKGLFFEKSNLPLTIWFNAVTLLFADQSLSDSALAQSLKIQRSTSKNIKGRILPVLSDFQSQSDSNSALVKAILKESEQEELLCYYAKKPKYEIIHGNCYEKLTKIPDKSVNSIITDRPYNIRMGELDKPISDIELLEQFEMLGEQFNRIITDNGVVVMFMRYEQFGACREAFRKYFKYEERFIWKKTNPSNLHCENRMVNAVEEALVFYKNSENHTFNKTRKSLQNIFECPVALRKNSGYHETPKPVKVMKHLVKTFSNEGDVVLDCFMGSGATGEAALAFGRRFIGIELALKYCESSAKRFKKCYKKRVKTANAVVAFIPEDREVIERRFVEIREFFHSKYNGYDTNKKESKAEKK
jgi:DNA modification methylase